MATKKNFSKKTHLHEAKAGKPRKAKSKRSYESIAEVRAYYHLPPMRGH